MWLYAYFTRITLQLGCCPPFGIAAPIWENLDPPLPCVCDTAPGSANAVKQ